MLHNSLKRFNVLVCHRRFGKTVFSLNEMIDRAVRNMKKNPQYAYIAPNYAQAKRVAWEMLKDYTKDFPGREVNEADLRIDIPRPQFRDKIRFLLLSAEKPGALRGIYLDGAVLDEYAECDPTVWSQVTRPALSDRLGWAIFIGTPKGQNHFHDIYEAAKRSDNWFHCVFKASETKIIAQSELEEARATMSDEEFEQEFECSFTAALVGAYYGKEMATAEADGRICTVPHDPALPVDTFWDLGVGDSTSIWFLQHAGKELHWIDYIEENGLGIADYVRLLKDKSRELKYSYREVYWPHDGAARSFETGKTRDAVFADLMGTRPIILPRHNVDDGINASRLLIAKSWFDAVKCERGINALRNYERKWLPKEKRFDSKPKHNWASHASDAYRIAAMGLRPENTRIDRLKLPRKSSNDWDIFKGAR